MQIDSVTHGDCLEVMNNIADHSIDLILCDLPYGITRCKFDRVIPFDPLWDQYKRVIKDNGAIVLTAMQPFSSILVTSNLDMFKYEWIWQKSYITGVLNAKKQPVRNHESILVFYKKQPVYNPQGVKVVNKMTRQGTASINYGKRPENTEYFQEIGNYPRSVQLISSKGESSILHPMQKPVALFEYLIRTYTNEGDTVLDNCAGSGTTAVACINTNRHYILIEKEQRYYDICCERINKAKESKL